jgi:hypothetical protein
MPLRNQARKSPKFSAHHSLLIADESPLPRSPGYSVKHPVNHPAGNRAGHSPSYPVRNPENYGEDYPASYWAGYLPENLVSYPVGYPDSNSADCSADYPENRPVSNPESNRADSWADYSESYWVDSLPDCWEDYLRSFDSRPIGRKAADGQPLQFDDLADSSCLSLGFAHEVDPGCQRPHVIHARMEVQHLTARDVEQLAIRQSRHKLASGSQPRTQ